MASIGSGYDLSASTYSPDGRVFQIEYAQKAVDAAGTVIGIRCSDGIVLAVQNLLTSKLLNRSENGRIYAVDEHVALAAAGLAPDTLHLLKRAKEECAEYRKMYKVPVPANMIAERVAQYVQAYTLYSSVRPFGVSAMIAVQDSNGPQLFMVEPSGVYYGFKGCAAGKGKQVAKTELEKLKLGELTCAEAIKEAARIIYVAHDEAKDKDFVLEMGYISNDTNGKFKHVPASVLQEAENAAKASLNQEMDQDE